MQKVRKYSEATKRAYLASYKKSEQTIRQFCHIKGLNHGTFYKWLHADKIAQEKKVSESPASKKVKDRTTFMPFIPINLLKTKDDTVSQKSDQAVDSMPTARQVNDRKNDYYRLVCLTEKEKYSLEIPLSIELDKLLPYFFNASSGGILKQGDASCA